MLGLYTKDSTLFRVRLGQVSLYLFEVNKKREIILLNVKHHEGQDLYRSYKTFFSMFLILEKNINLCNRGRHGRGRNDIVVGFSTGTAVTSTNKTDHHDITEILLKVALNTITLTL